MGDEWDERKHKKETRGQNNIIRVRGQEKGTCMVEETLWQWRKYLHKIVCIRLCAGYMYLHACLCVCKKESGSVCECVHSVY